MKASSARTARFGPYSLDLRSGELWKFGSKIKIGEQSFRILCLLLDANGEMVTREELRDQLWARDTFVDFDHGLNSAVQRLRDCLSDSAENPRWVATVPRRGYRFVGRVDWHDGNKIAPVLDFQPQPSETSRSAKPQTAVNAEAVEGSIPQPTERTVARAEIKPTRGNWRRFVGIAALIVVAVSLVDWSGRTLSPPPKITHTIQLTSDGREKFPQIVTDGVRVYFAELRNGHWTLSAIPISGGEPTAIPLPFPDAQVLNISPDKSELLIGEGPPINDNQLWRVPILAGPPRRMGSVVAHDAGWSPDGQKFMFMREGNVFLADSDGGNARTLDLPNTSPQIWAWSPRWSPEGSRITFERYVMDKHLSSIWEVSAQGEHPHLLLPNWQELPMQCCGAWSPDGSFFFFDVWKTLEGGPPIAPAPDIWAFRKQTGFLRNMTTEPVQLTAGPVHFFSHAFAPDGVTLFALSTQRREELSRFDSKAHHFFAYPGLGYAHSISFSRQGWVAYTKFPQGELWMKKADGSEPLQLTFRPLMAYGPEWSPDGAQIVFYGQEPGQRLGLYLTSLEGGKAHRLDLQMPADLLGPNWSPDGTSIVFAITDPAQPQIQVLNLQTRQLSKIPGSEGMRWPRWSPDNKYISALSRNDQLLLFDLKTKKWINLVPNVWNQIWSRDAKAIYFIGSQPEAGVFRLSLTDKRMTRVTNLDGVHISDTIGQPLFLTPQDEPLVRKQSDLETEIYALSLDTH
jgi:Tol biopolymer transport system component/DNA-binding winged helix-turn-helix (wHTH) protein